MAIDDSKTFLLRLATDVAAANKARQDIDSVKASLKQLQNQGGLLNKELASIDRQSKLDRVAADMGALAKTTALADEQAIKLAAHLKEINATPIEVSRAANTFANSASAAQQQTGGGINLGRIGSELRALPSTPIPGAGVSSDQISSIIRLGGVFQQLQGRTEELRAKVLDAAKSIGLGNIGAIGAIAGLGIAIKLLGDEIERTRKAAQADLDARANALKLIVQGDQQAIQSRLNLLAEERKIREAQAADAKRILNELTGGIAQQTGVIGSVISELDGRVIAARQNATAANDALKQTSAEFDYLTNATGKTAMTTEQAAAAEARLNAERGYAARLQGEASRALELLNLAATGSEKQVSDLIASLERQNQVYAVFKNQADEDLKYLQEGTEAYKSATDASKYFGDAIATNNASIKQATNFTLDAAKANDIKAASEKKAAEALAEIDKIRGQVATDAAKQAEALQAQADKTAAAYTALGDSFKQANLDQQARDLQQDAKRARTNRDEDVKNALETDAKLEDINQKRIDDYVSAEQRRADELEKIQRELIYNEQGAIETRNAVLLDSVQRSAKKQTEEAETQAKQDRKKADENSAKAFKDLQRDLALRAKQEALARAAEIREDKIADGIEYANRRAQYYREQDLLAQKNRAELLQLNNAYTKELTAQQKALAEIEKLDKAHYATIIAYAKGAQAEIAAILRGAGAGGAGLIGGVTGGTGLAPGNNVGGVNGIGGAGGFGGLAPQANALTIPINVAGGMSRAQVVQTVVGELNATLKSAGYN